MIDLEPALQADVPGISFDAVVGQQWSAGIGEVQSLRQDGQLGSVVIIELGTNGAINSGELTQMMSELAGVSRVVLVTNYVPDSYESSNNAIIEAGASQYKNVAVANWYALATANPGWLCSDGYHLSCGGPGAQEMAALIAKCV
jgi:lysophospholipase L1-like esterase